MTSRPTFLAIADAATAAHLDSIAADWELLHTFPTSDAYWDALDAGSIPATPDYVLVWAHGDGSDTDVPGSAVSLAHYSTVWAFTEATGGDDFTARLRLYEKELGLAGAMDSIHVVPVPESMTVEDIVRRELRDIVTFPVQETPSAPPTGPKRPNLASLEPSVAETSVSGGEAYDQSAVYSPQVSRMAGMDFTKLPQAREGQITIACMSSKGGSGKSTTALGLAGAIAQGSKKAGQAKKVVVVDLDVRDGQVGSLIGQYLPTAVSIRIQPEWNTQTVTDALVHDPKLGIDALLAPVRPRNAEDVGPDFYRQVIQILQTTHDVVILDCSVSYLDPLLGMAFALSDEILFVTTLATTSIQGMARALGEMFADPSEGGLGIDPSKIGIVANQVMSNVGITKDQVFSAALGSQIVGTIPAAFNEVLVATNSNRLDKLLTHPTLGQAYARLAKTCVPGITLTPLV